MMCDIFAAAITKKMVLRAIKNLRIFAYLAFYNKQLCFLQKLKMLSAKDENLVFHWSPLEYQYTNHPSIDQHTADPNEPMMTRGKKKPPHKQTNKIICRIEIERSFCSTPTTTRVASSLAKTQEEKKSSNSSKPDKTVSDWNWKQEEHCWRFWHGRELNEVTKGQAACCCC